ncbi:MAG: hypothetical protein HOK41_01840 [Nitrospina sp.]|mgnify:CR=1 FL=1|jgi:ABC-type phosphate/phosphonate transport system ATPase subunit|nr:hypothetical protein [Nitrospinaceae bacterium]MBT5469321.1 hypothetical protein [Nitrospina sp.]
MQLLLEINKQEGVTLIYNLHLPALARELGSKVLALDAGRIISEVSAKESPE